MLVGYNGYRSWNGWNVALWIGNDEPLYRFAKKCLEEAERSVSQNGARSIGKGDKKRMINRATTTFLRGYGGEKTPDGATYNRISVKTALAGLVEA